MAMNLPVTSGISILTVFLEGIISFFSPCVLPLIPVYIAYLSGGTLKKESDGSFHYNRKKVLINTFFFTVGISFAFLILGLGMSAIGRLFSGHQLLFSKIGGIIIILFGLYQLGFFGMSSLMSREFRLPFDTKNMTMSPFAAFLFGFLLSFAWTPCIGPVLSSILIMTASADTVLKGLLLIFVYTLGYVIPFLLVGLFTTTLLEFFSRHKSIVRYSVKIGGALLIVIGLMMFTGQLNGLSSYLSSVSIDTGSTTQGDNTGNIVKDSVVKSGGSDINSVTDTSQKTDAESSKQNDESLKESVRDSISKKNDESVNDHINESREETLDETEESSENASNEDVYLAFDFTLKDQHGNTHTLSDYKGKIVFLNFWATWCPPCKEELPYIQELFEEYSEKTDSDIVFLTITFPGLGQEKNVTGIKKFTNDHGYTFPVLMDTEYITEEQYYINAFPTTFLIDPHGNILGYVPGGMNKEMMEDVIDRARRESARYRNHVSVS
ncbi:cytochrome c biogenesis protein/redoxin [Oribacterium sp. P6A1]|uniref:cytochrome c biogenesis protein/redoxin n=1 Tax=Oribacterium sp. P6A1 TaxID=1410612 RepID=UPI000A7E7917|nr:cytochrome c biogenesis protein/redoxin [Oribacterium sp. P6A1]